MTRHHSLPRLRATLLLAAVSSVGSAVAAQQLLDDTWTLTAGSQTVSVNPDGSFRIQNISAADAFGPGGPGTRPDFLSDEPIRITGQGLINGEVRYAFSEPFVISNGETYFVSDLTITPTPPPLPESLDLDCPDNIIEVGETIALTTTATLGDRTMQDVTPRTSWTTYRTSNPDIATVDENGMVTGVSIGVVYVTASNDGVTAVKSIVVIPTDDPLSTIIGYVNDEDGDLVEGADVRVAGLGIETLSDAQGRFQLDDVPTGLGNVVVSASIIDPVLGRLSGTSGAVTPVPDGFTDVGRITLAPSDSSGMDFIVCFPPNLGSNALQLFIASDVVTSANVHVDGLAFDEDHPVLPGLVTTVDLPTSAIMSGGLSTRAIRVSADSDIRVYGLNQRTATSDAFTALPLDAFGTDYLAMTYSGSPQIGIVAAQDNTTVNITPPGGSTQTVVIPTIEDAYLYQFGGDLTGTRITSNLPIGVFSGNTCTNVGGCSACDHLIEQMPPVEVWGNTTLSIPLAARSGGDVFRILAAENATTVNIFGQANETLNLGAGQYVERTLDGPNVFVADKPILVCQFARGQSCDGQTGDPMMMILPPSEQYLQTYTLSTPASGFAANYMNVIAPDALVGTANLLVDGMQIDAGDFVPIGTSGFSGAQVSISAGCHDVIATEPVGVFVYGWNNFDSYGYPGGLALNSALGN